MFIFKTTVLFQKLFFDEKRSEKQSKVKISKTHVGFSRNSDVGI